MTKCLFFFSHEDGHDLSRDELAMCNLLLVINFVCMYFFLVPNILNVPIDMSCVTSMKVAV